MAGQWTKENGHLMEEMFIRYMNIIPVSCNANISIVEQIVRENRFVFRTDFD